MKSVTIHSLLAMLVSLYIFGCSGNSTSQKDEMASFTSDSNFAKAHPSPAHITFKGTGAWISFPTPDGDSARAWYIPASKDSRKFLFVIHEWWGLNDQIRQEAEHLHDSLDNVHVLALDLYDGKVTDDPEQAGEFMNAVKPARCEAIIRGALDFVGDDARIATIGWCFGGGWSLRASILAGEKAIATVMYYGMPVRKADELAPLKCEILGIFAKKDEWINEKVVSDFEALCKATGKKLTVHWFDADHAFANPSNPKYNAEAARQATKLTLDFLRKAFQKS